MSKKLENENVFADLGCADEGVEINTTEDGVFESDSECEEECVMEAESDKADSDTQEDDTEAKRLEAIELYNKQNEGDSWIDEEKPTPEEVKAISEEYKTKVEAFNAEMFTIADKANALRVAKFLKKWNEEDVAWEGEGWRGAIFFDAIIKQFIEECEKEEKDLVVDWQTLTYLFVFMRSTKGVGLKSAIKFSTIAEEYNRLLDVIGDEFTKHNAEGEKLERLQGRWAAYENGLKLHYCADEEKDKK